MRSSHYGHYGQRLTSVEFQLHHLQYDLALRAYTAWSSHMDNGSTVPDLTYGHFHVGTHQPVSTTLVVYMIHMTEWRIKLRGRTLSGVQSVGHVGFKRLWVSRVERVRRGWTPNASSVGSRVEPAQGLAQLAWIWLTVASVVIQSDSGWTSTQFTICFHLTESHFS